MISPLVDIQKFSKDGDNAEPSSDVAANVNRGNSPAHSDDLAVQQDNATN